MNTMHIKLPSIATLENCTALAARLPAMLAGGSGVILIDASAVRQFDSTAISLLLHAQRLAQGLGRSLKLTEVPDTLFELARLYGVYNLLCQTGEATPALPDSVAAVDESAQES